MPASNTNRGSIGRWAAVVAGIACMTAAVVLRPRGTEPPVPAPNPGVVRSPIAWADIQVPPVPEDLASLAKAGERLFLQECAVCHGKEGKGDGEAAPRLEHRPRDFTRGNFKFRSSALGEVPFDDDLYRTITRGIPVAGMPSYADLAEADRWALIAHVKTLSRRQFDDGDVVDYFEARRPTNRISYDVEGRQVTKDAAKRGAELFRGERGGCILCHGPSGRGDGISANDLKDDNDLPVRPADLTRGPAVLKTGCEPKDIFRILTNGMCGTPMPSFRGNLTEDERWDVVCFVTSLFEPIPAGELLYARAGCKGCHKIGGGERIGPDLAGVTERRGESFLRGWLSASGNPQARTPPDGTPTPKCSLAPGEVDLILGYLRDAGAGVRK
ncbi:MAG: c-type cytochrome [Planctomycetota bacterium]